MDRPAHSVRPRDLAYHETIVHKGRTPHLLFLLIPHGDGGQIYGPSEKMQGTGPANYLARGLINFCASSIASA
jgi:hypothetical protein